MAMARSTTTTMTNSPGPKSLTRPHEVLEALPSSSSSTEPTTGGIFPPSTTEPPTTTTETSFKIENHVHSETSDQPTTLAPTTIGPQCTNSSVRQHGLRRKYCAHEVTALVMGVQRYADDSCPWSCILHDAELSAHFHGRSGVDLKDKWRTLVKTRPELQSYTENRVVQRQYRPFSRGEEVALIEGVRQYAGERNLWSMILNDQVLKLAFDRRTNVQLKDKFRTMKRAGQIIEVPTTGEAGEATAKKTTTITGKNKSRRRGTEKKFTTPATRKRKTPDVPASAVTEPASSVSTGDLLDSPATFNV